MLHLLLSICQGDTQFRAKCSPAFLRLLWREPQLFVTAMFRRHVLAVVVVVVIYFKASEV